MIMRIFSVRDVQVEAYLQPFFSPTEGAAIRSLMEAANDSAHQFFKNSSDYSLYLLGEFDDSTGVITPTDPKRIVSVSELIKT